MARVAFKQCDLERVFRALKAVGDDTRTVKITPEGDIVVLTAPEADSERPLSPLERWERSRGQGRA